VQGIDSLLQMLVGEKLSSVTFVLDYWQLDFDGHTLTAFSKVTVNCADWAVSSGDAGFRDRFCERIAKIVLSAEYRDDEGITISFEDGSSIHLSSKPEDYRGPEAIMLQCPDQTFWVV
jgi:hypothetical protein